MDKTQVPLTPRFYAEWLAHAISRDNRSAQRAWFEAWFANFRERWPDYTFEEFRAEFEALSAALKAARNSKSSPARDDLNEV